MVPISRDRMLDVLRDGTAEQRVALVESLPPSGFKDQVRGLIGADHPGILQ